MKILALDTCLSACSVAITDGEGAELASAFEEGSRGQVERILPMIDQMFEAADVEKTDIDYIAVTKGPGTFAGVRIGLATAKGLSLALNVKILAVTTLEATAQAVLGEYGEGSGFNFTVCHDARRSEFYTQSFNLSKGVLTALTSAEAISYDALEGALSEIPEYIFGTGAEIAVDYFEHTTVKVGKIIQHKAAAVALAAIQQIACKTFNPVEPLYIRPPDAIKPKPVFMPFLK